MSTPCRFDYIHVFPAHTHWLPLALLALCCAAACAGGTADHRGWPGSHASATEVSTSAHSQGVQQHFAAWPACGTCTSMHTSITRTQILPHHICHYRHLARTVLDKHISIPSAGVHRSAYRKYHSYHDTSGTPECALACCHKVCPKGRHCALPARTHDIHPLPVAYVTAPACALAARRVLAQIVGEHSGETNPGGGSSSSHEALAQLSSLFASISIAPDTAGQNSACTSTTSVPSIPAAGPSNTAGLPQGAGLPFQRRTPSQPIPFMQRPQVPSTQGTGQGSQGQRSPGSSMELGSPSQGQPGAWIPGWHASTSTAGSTAHATAGAGLVLPGLPCCGVSQGSGAGAGGSCELQGQQQGLLGGGTAPILVVSGWS